MPDISEEELGRRRFQIRKEKAVEDALIKIRHNIGPAMISLTQEDMQSLKSLLEEVWVNGDRGRWDKYSFSALTISQIDALIAIGRDAVYRQKPDDYVTAADSILSGRK